MMTLRINPSDYPPPDPRKKPQENHPAQSVCPGSREAFFDAVRKTSTADCADIRAEAEKGDADAGR